MKKLVTFLIVAACSVLSASALNFKTERADSTTYFVLSDSCEIVDALGDFLSDGGQIYFNSKNTSLVCRYLRGDNTLTAEESNLAASSIKPFFPDQVAYPECSRNRGVILPDRLKAVCLTTQEYEQPVGADEVLDVNISVVVRVKPEIIASALERYSK